MAMISMECNFFFFFFFFFSIHLHFLRIPTELGDLTGLTNLELSDMLKITGICFAVS